MVTLLPHENFLHFQEWSLTYHHTLCPIVFQTGKDQIHLTVDNINHLKKDEKHATDDKAKKEKFQGSSSGDATLRWTKKFTDFTMIAYMVRTLV